nr:hypothetical protein [uncultured Dialister sp.]
MICYGLGNKAALDRSDAILELFADVCDLVLDCLEFKGIFFILLHLYGLPGDGFHCFLTGENPRSHFTYKVFYSIFPNVPGLAFLFEMSGTGIVIIDGTCFGSPRYANHLAAATPAKQFACHQEVFIAGPDVMFCPEI